jgi:hypothetical protein
MMRKVVGLGRLVVESIVREILRLPPTMAHFRHHSDTFQALEMPEMTIEARSWLGQARLVFFDYRLLGQWPDERLYGP